MFDSIIKRDGRRVPYDISKITDAIRKAMEASGRDAAGQECERLAALVEDKLSASFNGEAPGIEDIQDMVETVLKKKRLRPGGPQIHHLPQRAHP